MENGTSVATPSGNANERDALVIPSSWDDIAVLLKMVPCFTVLEPSISGVNAFFPFTRRHFVELPGDPCLTSVVRPSYGTPKSILQCTYSM